MYRVVAIVRSHRATPRKSGVCPAVAAAQCENVQCAVAANHTHLYSSNPFLMLVDEEKVRSTSSLYLLCTSRATLSWEETRSSSSCEILVRRAVISAKRERLSSEETVGCTAFASLLITASPWYGWGHTLLPRVEQYLV